MDEVRKYLAKTEPDRSRLMRRLIEARDLPPEHPINLHVNEEVRQALMTLDGECACPCQRGLFARQASPALDCFSLSCAVQLCMHVSPAGTALQ